MPKQKFLPPKKSKAAAAKKSTNHKFMDKVKIKRVKRNKRKITKKEKILAGVGVGSTLMGMGGQVGGAKPQVTQMVRTQTDTKGSTRSRVKESLKKIFSSTLGASSAKAEGQISISDDDASGVRVGEYRVYTFTADGGSGDYTWSIVSGNLPDGMDINGYNGGIYGTPTQEGTYSVMVQAVDNADSSVIGTINKTIVVDPALNVASVTGVTLNQSNLELNSGAADSSTSYTVNMSDGSADTAGVRLDYYDYQDVVSAYVQGNQIVINALPNTTGEDRTAVITVTSLADNNYYADLQVVVHPEAAAPMVTGVSVGQSGVALNSDGGNAYVSFAVNMSDGSADTAGVRLDYYDSQDWLEAHIEGDNVVITAQPNSTGNSRSGTVTVTSLADNNYYADINVTQDTQNVASVTGVTLNQSNLELNSGAADSSTSYTVNMSDGSADTAGVRLDYYDYQDVVSAYVQGNQIVINALPNTTGEDRTAVITVTSLADNNYYADLQVVVHPEATQQSLSITTDPNLQSIQKDQYMEYQMAAEGGSGNYAWTLGSNDVPVASSDDIAISGDGTLWVKPSEAGTFHINVNVSDGENTASQDFILVVTEAGTVTMDFDGTPDILDVNGTYAVTVTINNPDGGSTGWHATTSDPTAVTFVDPNTLQEVGSFNGESGQNFTLIGKGSGKSAVITVVSDADNSVSRTFTVNVNQAAVSVSQITLESDKSELHVGESATLTYDITMSDGSQGTLDDVYVNYGDQDWFSVEATGGNQLIITALQDPGDGQPHFINLQSKTDPNISADVWLTVVSAQSLSITTDSSLQSIQKDQYIEYQIAAEGGSGNYAWTLGDNDVPVASSDDISITDSGILVVKPNAAGTFHIHIDVSDGENTAGKDFTLTVTEAGAAVITTNLPSSGRVNVLYGPITLQTGGLAENKTWNVSAGNLPPGMSLNSATGVVQGILTAAGSYAFTIQVTDGTNTAAKDFTVTVLAAPEISTDSLPDAVKGTGYNQVLAATGFNNQAVTWSNSGSLPPGLSLSTTGVISGTPTAAGTYTFAVRAALVSDSNVMAVKNLTIKVTESTAYQITGLTFDKASVKVGDSYKATFTSPNPSSLNNVYFDVQVQVNGTTSTVLNWQQGASADHLVTADLVPGTYKVVSYRAHAAQDDHGGNFTALPNGGTAVTITTGTTASITTASLPNGKVGTAYSQTLQASGITGTKVWTVSTGTLPAGLNINSSTGAITGTPTTAGSYSFAIKVADAANPSVSATKNFTLVIDASGTASITTASLPNGKVGTAYSQTLQASGITGTKVWTVSTGTLPAGLNINSSTGAITGTPTTAGSYSFAIKVADAANPSVSATKNFTLVIDASGTASITTASLPNGKVGTAYSQTLQASGITGTKVWTVSTGTLPAGLNINSSTGAITGTPTTAGSYSFTVEVTDGTNTASRNFTVIISSAATAQASITTSSLLDGTVGTAYSQTLAATGISGDKVWSMEVGELPGGLELDSETGVISGTPTESGSYTFTVQVADSEDESVSATKTFTIVIEAEGTVTITTTSLPNGKVGTAYSKQLSANGITGTKVWSMQSGELPDGLDLDSETGTISGTPTAAGSYSFSIRVEDEANEEVYAVKSFTLTITSASDQTAAITTATLANGTVNSPYSQTLQASGITGTKVWSMESGELPDGLDLDSETGTISGTPTATGSYTFTVRVEDEASEEVYATKAFTIIITGQEDNVASLQQRIAQLEQQLAALRAQQNNSGGGGTSYLNEYNRLLQENQQLRQQLNNLNNQGTLGGLQMPPGYPASQGYVPPEGQNQATPPSQTVYYTVKRGDTLWSIAQRFYGDGSRWREILEANTDKVKNPRTMRVGITLVIPGVPAGATIGSSAGAATPAAELQRIKAELGSPIQPLGTYTVKRGDTLWGLAQRYYGDGTKWIYIQAANAEKVPNPRTMRVGITLVIPKLGNQTIQSSNPPDDEEVEIE
ncbi:MAG: putative Ig domain-containing protein [Patescibacteria group bacterium]|nr:putative Ig domain-containing protein [Patescibacteria group bacterium]